MATNLLKFFSIGSDGGGLLVGVSRIGCAAAWYILGQERVLLAVGCLWLGQWTFGAFLFLPLHYPPQSAWGGFFFLLPMDRQ